MRGLFRLLDGVDPRERLQLWIVLAVAATVLVLEGVSFQTLIFVNDYLPATQVISIALLGIALGGLAAYFLERVERRRAIGAILVAFPFAVMVGLPVIARLNSHPYLMMPLLAAPYALASALISLSFNRLRPNRVYLFDLAGAGIGAALTVVLLPPLREEGSFLFLGLLATFPLALEIRRRGLAGEARGGIQVAALFAALLSLGLLIVHLAADPFNLMRIARADEEEYPYKLFRATRPAEGKTEPKLVITHSRGSLIERIDVGYFSRHKKRDPRGHALYTLYNGRINDNISRGKSRVKGHLDRRLPTRLKLGQDPDTLLIGPAAQGLTKAVFALGHGRIDAIEINPAIVDLMLNELWNVSARAYEGMNVVVGDARTFLARTDHRYDFITLLNTHRVRTLGHQGPPEYCHTIEAMNAYLDHLEPDGFALFEERNINERAELGIRRVVRTALAALAARGAKRPADHLAIYEMFDGCRERVWFKDRSRCRRGGLYTFVLVKRTPITDAEHAHLTGEWTDALGARGDPKKAYRGIEWMYVPQAPLDDKWTATVRAERVFDVEDLDPAVHNMDPITDDRPFPYDVFLAREKPWEVFRTTLVMALVMVLLPALVSFFYRRREKGPGESAPPVRRLANNALLICYFSLLGLGYLLLEIALMQKLQIFLSSPINALVVVLAGLLVFSGAGGYFSARVGKRGAVVAVVAVAGLAGLASLGLGALVERSITLPFPVRVVEAIALVGLLGFAMGVPFPYGLRVAKQTLGQRHAGLFFGINGAIAALATPLSIVCSMAYGFDLTLLLGGAAYLTCALLLVPLFSGPARGKERDA
jgi:hypothetical protein